MHRMDRCPRSFDQPTLSLPGPLLPNRPGPNLHLHLASEGQDSCFVCEEVGSFCALSHTLFHDPVPKLSTRQTGLEQGCYESPHHDIYLTRIFHVSS
jgi:hypothetical protein